MNVRDRRFSGGKEVELAHRVSIEAFLHGVGLVDKFRKLSDADHALPIDNVRRRNFGVAVFRGVEVEEILDQRAFEAGAPIGVEKETAAAEFGAAREIDESEFFAKLDVI